MKSLKSFLVVRPGRVRALRRIAERLLEDNHYRIIFVAYTIVVSFVSSCLIYAIQRSQEPVQITTFFASWFTAISSFCLTGLSVARFPAWHYGSLVVMILTMEFGSIVFCSSIPSLLRIRRLRQISCRSPADRRLVRRHLHVNIAIVWCCSAYWIVLRVIVFALLAGHRGVWWTVFHSSSMLTSAGFALDPNNFATPETAGDSYLIVVFCILMPVGNTLLPIWHQLFMRIWRAMLFRIADKFPRQQYITHIYLFNLSAKELGDAINELLLRPSAYYTHLFLPKQTLVLFLMWCALTAVDYVMFIPEYGTTAFVVGRHQWLQALFQTITVRTTGFTLMDIGEVHLGHLSYWVMAMYLSSYPFIITEGTARGLYDDNDDDFEFPEPVEPPPALPDIAMGVVASPVDDDLPNIMHANVDLRAVLRGAAFEDNDDDTSANDALCSDHAEGDALSPHSNMSATPGEERLTSTDALLLDGSVEPARLTKTSLEQLQLHDLPPSRLIRRSMNEPIMPHEGSQSSNERTSFVVRQDDGFRLHIQNDETVASTSQADGASSAAFVPKGVKTALLNIQSQAGTTVAQEIGWLYLSCIVICYLEGFNLSESTDMSPLAKLLFEVTSAFGTVGLSIADDSAPDLSYSFVLSTTSQVIICFLMYFGKFRGLPQTIELDAVQHLLQRRDSMLIRREVHFSEPTQTSRDDRLQFEGIRGATPVGTPRSTHSAPARRATQQVEVNSCHDLMSATQSTNRSCCTELPAGDDIARSQSEKEIGHHD